MRDKSLRYTVEMLNAARSFPTRRIIAFGAVLASVLALSGCGASGETSGDGIAKTVAGQSSDKTTAESAGQRAAKTASSAPKVRVSAVLRFRPWYVLPADMQKLTAKTSANFAEQIRSPAVLSLAMQKPGVAELPTIRELKKTGDDPVKWLAANLDFTLVDSDVILVRMVGNDGKQLMALVDAVDAAFLEAIVKPEREMLAKRRAELDEKHRRKFEELKRAESEELERFKMHRSAVFKRLREAFDKLSASEIKLRKLDESLQVFKREHGSADRGDSAPDIAARKELEKLQQARDVAAEEHRRLEEAFDRVSPEAEKLTDNFLAASPDNSHHEPAVRSLQDAANALGMELAAIDSELELPPRVELVSPARIVWIGASRGGKILVAATVRVVSDAFFRRNFGQSAGSPVHVCGSLLGGSASFALQKPGIMDLPMIHKLVDSGINPGDWLSDNVEIDTSEQSKEVSVSLRGDNGAQLATFINAMVDSFMQRIIEVERDQLARRRDLLKKKLAQYRGKLDSANKSKDALSRVMANQKLPEEKLSDLQADIDERQEEIGRLSPIVKSLASEVGKIDAELKQPADIIVVRRAHIEHPNESPGSRFAPNERATQ